jgi:hypothetical protein
MSTSRRVLPLLLILSPVAGPVADTSVHGDIISTPTPSRYSVCFDHSCTSVVIDSLSDAEWRQVAAPLRNPASSAAQERAAIARSMALFETIIGRHTGTTMDRGRNIAGFGQPGQLDCIDESTNTTTYLRLLERDGLLRFHRVAERATRFGLFVGMPHSTAVIEEFDSGSHYAVDSWFRDNGQLPHIVRLEDWRSGLDPADD